MSSDAKSSAASRALAPFLRPAKPVTSESLQSLCRAGEVLEQKLPSLAPKVILVHPENDVPVMVKVWHPDRLISSARLYPYSTRFRRHAAILRGKGFSAPVVRGWGRIRGIGAHFVSYEVLPGKSLRQLKPEISFPDVADYIARLHEAGVDFRSLHLGNILLDGDADFSLIDLTDCSFHRRPLSLRARAKRIVYLCTHRTDQTFMLEGHRWADLMRACSDAIGCAPMELLNAARSQKHWEVILEREGDYPIEDLFSGS